MSKPRHSERYRGYYVGHGIYSREQIHAKKGSMSYEANLINEIEEIKALGNRKHVAKLRKYLKRVSP